MFARRALNAALIFFALGLGAPGLVAAAAPVAVACPDINSDVKDSDIRCALQRWYDAANTRNPDAVVGLYAPSHVLLLSTLKAAPYTTQASIKSYFVHLLAEPNFGVRPGPEVLEKIDLFAGGGAVSGFYEFGWTAAGKPVRTPARFTFVFAVDASGRQLLIATHHSSKLPE